MSTKAIDAGRLSGSAQTEEATDSTPAPPTRSAIRAASADRCGQPTRIRRTNLLPRPLPVLGPQAVLRSGSGLPRAPATVTARCRCEMRPRPNAQGGFAVSATSALTALPPGRVSIRAVGTTEANHMKSSGSASTLVEVSRLAVAGARLRGLRHHRCIRRPSSIRRSPGRDQDVAVYPEASASSARKGSGGTPARLLLA